MRGRKINLHLNEKKNSFPFCFVSSLQHTLVTEIRELIFPEDRTRYDELVYRRGRGDIYGDPLDRHRVCVFILVILQQRAKIINKKNVLI